MSPAKEQNQMANDDQTNVKTFDDLLKGIAKLFESNEVDVDELKKLMQSYESDPADWIQYVNLAKDRYTRVLIDGGNGKYNLMLLCWPANTSSSIHDHPDSHCILKVLSGSVSEVRYCWPKDSYKNDHCDGGIGGINDSGEGEGMIKLAENRLQAQSVAYINDSIGLHRIMNPDVKMPAFSLHLYSPPFDHCRIFDEKTGKCQKIHVGFDQKEIEAVRFRVKHLYKYNCDTNDNQSDNSDNCKDILLFEKEHFIDSQQDGKTRA